MCTVIVLVLLGGTVFGPGFGTYTAQRLQPAGGGGGGAPLLIRGWNKPAPEQDFAFAAAPMAVVQRRPTQCPTQDGLASSSEESVTRRDLVTHTVGLGDTLESLAVQYDVAAYTIFWVNGLRTSEVEIGMVLTIPPLSGVPHTVEAGETLESIADMYGVRPGNIVGYPPNHLKHPYRLRSGQEVFVPGGVIEIPSYPFEGGDRPPPTLVQMPGGEKMRWPTWGWLSAPFGWSRAHGHYHRGIDIANSYGTPIYAAAAGTVVESGWDALGWWAEIDHGNGFHSIYGHLSQRPLVSVGEEVEKGQQIGSMGSTYGPGGYASGVHLHFGVKHHGVYIDPLPLLEH